MGFANGRAEIRLRGSAAMRHRVQLKGVSHAFPDLKTLLAKASPLRSGDELAGVVAVSAEERVAARGQGGRGEVRRRTPGEQPGEGWVRTAARQHAGGTCLRRHGWPHGCLALSEAGGGAARLHRRHGERLRQHSHAHPPAGRGRGRRQAAEALPPTASGAGERHRVTGWGGPREWTNGSIEHARIRARIERLVWSSGQHVSGDTRHALRARGC